MSAECIHPERNRSSYHDSSVKCDLCNCVIEQFGKKINPPSYLGMLEINRKLKTLSEPIYSEETLELAEMIANLPPLSNDKKSIEKWAKRLADDIGKGRD